jgi:predicted helicase
MTYLGWQRRARAIGAHIASLDESARSAALAAATTALVARSCRSELGGAVGDGEPWLDAQLSDASLDDELRALAERHGSVDAAPFVYEHIEHAIDPRARVDANRYATPSPVARWMARAALRAIDEHGMGGALDGWLALDPACGAGALLVALAREAPALARGLHGIERDPIVALGAKTYLRAALGLEDSEARVRVQDALTGPWQRPREAPGVIIVANPPYATDEPMNAWLRALVHGQDRRSTESYRARGDERAKKNSKWLDTAQLRFLRWIHSECDRSERAVAVVALGHAWVDHPTFATVRRALCASFDEVSVLDLHGAARNGLLAPDGTRDQNVFDIQQGLALLLLVRSRGGRSVVRRADLWGSRAEKFAALDADRVAWSAVDPRAPEHRFEVLAAGDAEGEDERAWRAMSSTLAVFAQSSPAIITGRDALVLGFERAACEAVVRALADHTVSDDAVRSKLKLAIDEGALRALRARASEGALAIRRWSYRPWDERWAIDDRALVDRARTGPVMDALRTEKTLAIVTRRQSPPERAWNYLLVTALPACDGVLRADPHGTEVLLSRERLEDGALRSNASPAWLRALGERLGLEASDALWQRAFEYVVGTLESARYRQRFQRWIASEAPRVPWPSDASEFERTAREGARCVARHTGAIEPARDLRWTLGEQSASTAMIARARWSERDQRLLLADGAWIEGLSAAELDCTIGARRPALRWLEDRVGCAVTDVMIERYATVIARVRAELRQRDDAR